MKCTINIIVEHLWKGALSGKGEACWYFGFCSTPCTCTSFLSWPCRCISLYHHCKAFYFRFIFSFIFVITSFNLHWSVSAKPPLPCCGVAVCRVPLSPKVYILFRFAKLQHLSQIVIYNYIEKIYICIENT